MFTALFWASAARFERKRPSRLEPRPAWDLTSQKFPTFRTTAGILAAGHREEVEERVQEGRGPSDGELEQEGDACGDECEFPKSFEFHFVLAFRVPFILQ